MSDWNAAFSVGEVQQFVVASDPYTHDDGSTFLFTICVRTHSGEHFALRVADLHRIAELVAEFAPQEIRAEGADAELILGALDMLAGGATVH